MYIRSAGHPVTREEAAEQVGISRKLAAFHLDKLVDVGLLVAGVDDTRPRRVGRAPKAYRPADSALLLSIPHREYERLATLLLDAALAVDAGESPAVAGLRVARGAGEALGASVRSGSTQSEAGRPCTLAAIEAVLDAEGFEPFRSSPHRIRLRNCPFHPLAQREPALVCAINHAFLGGLLDGLHASSLQAELEPAPDECCVEIRRARPAEASS